MLQEYKADPEFKNKGFQPEQKSIYSIDDFQRISSKLLAHQSELKDFEERLKKITADYDTLKKNQALARQEHEDKKREQNEFKTKDIAEERLDRKKMSMKQRGELLDLEGRLLGYRKDLADLKIKEVDQRAHFIEQSIKILKLQLEVLVQEAEHVRKELRIDKKDLAAAQNTLKNQTAESNKLTEDDMRRLEALNQFKQQQIIALNDQKKRYAVKDSDMAAFFNWTYQPATIADWNALIDIGRLNDLIVFEADPSKELILARIEAEKAKVAEAELNGLLYSHGMI